MVRDYCLHLPDEMIDQVIDEKSGLAWKMAPARVRDIHLEFVRPKVGEPCAQPAAGEIRVDEEVGQHRDAIVTTAAR